MKEGWRYKKLKELYPIVMGKTPPRGISKFWDPEKKTHNLWVSIADLSKNEGKEITETKEYISDEAIDSIKRIPKGSLLVSFKLTLGKMAFAGEDLYTNEAIMSLEKRDDIDLKFLYYYFSSLDWGQLASGNEKVKGKTLNKKSLGEIPVAILSLSEQERIVERLDTAFAQIDELKKNAERQLAEARALFQSTLTQAMQPKLGWQEKKLGKICRIERGGSPRPIKQFITDSLDGLNWIKIGDTDPQGKYIYSTREKIKPEGLRKSRWVTENDFLLSNSMSFGRPYILKTNGCIHDGWLVLRDYQENLDIDFFYYLLTSSYVQRQFKTKAQGSTVSNLNTDRVADVSVYFPDITQQQVIASHLDSVSAHIKDIEEISKTIVLDCDALKQALLRQIFE